MLPTHAVKAIIKNAKGELLLLQRTARDKEKGGNYDLPGGLVEEGEDEQAALIREVKEELGVSVIIKKKGCSWKFFRPKDEQWVYVNNYVCELAELNLTLSNEHQHYEWVAIENIASYPVKDKSFYTSI